MKILFPGRKGSHDSITRLSIRDGQMVLGGIRPPHDSISLMLIRRIVAYKKDLLTSDLICFNVEYELSDHSTWHVTIHEEMPGFHEVEAELSKLSGYDVNWREHVVLPPFATSETVLFDRNLNDAGAPAKK